MIPCIELSSYHHNSLKLTLVGWFRQTIGWFSNQWDAEYVGQGSTLQILERMSCGSSRSRQFHQQQKAELRTMMDYQDFVRSLWVLFLFVIQLICLTIDICNFFSDPGSPVRYVLKIHFFIEFGLKMIQFKIQFKTKSNIFIQKNIHSK